jgi:hypothetical protein
LSTSWPYRLEPEAFAGLQFNDFPGAGIDDVAWVLYHNEPQFMRALEADVRERGVQEPVELVAADTIEEGHHRVAAAYRAGVPVPVADGGEPYPVDEAERSRWRAQRLAHPEEYDARMNHDPRHWDAIPGAPVVPLLPEAQRGLEAGA